MPYFRLQLALRPLLFLSIATLLQRRPLLVICRSATWTVSNKTLILGSPLVHGVEGDAIALFAGFFQPVSHRMVPYWPCASAAFVYFCFLLHPEALWISTCVPAHNWYHQPAHILCHTYLPVAQKIKPRKKINISVV